MKIPCPRCGSPLLETYTDRIEGTVFESTDQCDNCGYIREWVRGESQEFEGEEMIGMYDHLNREDPFTTSLSMTQVVEQIVRMNYGQHRFLSELVRQRKAKPDYKQDVEYRQHTEKLEQLLNEGFF